MANEVIEEGGWDGVTWVVMDQVLFHSAIEHIRAYDQLKKDESIGANVLQYEEIRHAASALLLVCAAMEGHANYIAQSAIHGLMPKRLKLTSGAWESLETRLSPEAKWLFLAAVVACNMSILNPGTAPFQQYLEVVGLRNNLIAHSKMNFKQVQLPPGVPPDAEAFNLSEFKEVAKLTIDNANRAVDAAVGVLKILYDAMGKPEKLPGWAW